MEQIQQGLSAIKEAVNGILEYYIRDDTYKTVKLLSNALTKMEEVSKEGTKLPIRFFRDLARIAPDFRIVLNMFEGFRENRKRRPSDPDADESWSTQRWLEYYREQARLEEPIIAIVEDEGLSDEALERGMQQMMEDSEEQDKRSQETILCYNLMRNRDAVFNDHEPERFLDLKEIPEIKDDDDDDYKIKKVEFSADEDEPSEPWSKSLPDWKSGQAGLPELTDWNDNDSANSFNDDELSRPDFTRDPVYQILDPFVHRVMKCLKDDYVQRVKEIPPEKRPLHTALEHYIILLALKSQVRLASCGVWEEEAGHDAPRKGAYMFSMDCLGKIVQAIEKFSPQNLSHLAEEAKTIKEQIGTGL